MDGRRRGRGLVALTLAAGLVAGGAYVPGAADVAGGLAGDVRDVVAGAAGDVDDVAGDLVDALGGLRGVRPLGRPPEIAVGGSHTFTMTQPHDPAAPVTYNPCERLRYVVSDADAPAGSAGLVEEAVAEISAATGLVFEHAGTTEEAYSADRPAWDLPRYGPRASPVLVAWTTPETAPELAGDVAGVGGSVAVEVVAGGPLRYVSGAVALDAPDLAGMLTVPGGEAQVRALIVHELAHVVGLGHVDDPAELMNAENLGVTGLGPGDRQGLAALGSGSCLG